MQSFDCPKDSVSIVKHLSQTANTQAFVSCHCVWHLIVFCMSSSSIDSISRTSSSFILSLSLSELFYCLYLVPNVSLLFSISFLALKTQIKIVDLRTGMGTLFTNAHASSFLSFFVHGHSECTRRLSSLPPSVQCESPAGWPPAKVALVTWWRARLKTFSQLHYSPSWVLVWVSFSGYVCVSLHYEVINRSRAIRAGQSKG